MSPEGSNRRSWVSYRYWAEVFRNCGRSPIFRTVRLTVVPSHEFTVNSNFPSRYDLPTAGGPVGAGGFAVAGAWDTVGTFDVGGTAGAAALETVGCGVAKVVRAVVAFDVERDESFLASSTPSAARARITIATSNHRGDRVRLCAGRAPWSSCGGSEWLARTWVTSPVLETLSPAFPMGRFPESTSRFGCVLMKGAGRGLVCHPQFCPSHHRSICG